MATLSRAEILSALQQLGELAASEGKEIDLLVVGGAAMVLAYNARQSTKDIDAVILAPRQAEIVRRLAKVIAETHGWREDWLNDAAKGYLVGYSMGPILFSAPGITVRSPSAIQLLAMKLSAWRDDVDINDARRLLQELGTLSEQESEQESTQDEVWQQIERHLIPGDELKAFYAFQDLWEELHGKH